METLTTINAMRNRIREARWTSSSIYGRDGSSSKIGFIPTMGFLHDGHASLMRTARAACDFVVVSIFVNPLQFGPNEDFETYPRSEDEDVKLARACGVDVVFMPDVREMYPDGQGTLLTKVSVARLTQVLCGRSRPTFFDGVTTVVAKLFNIVQPDFAYFGLKDAQQVAVIQQMVADLNIPVTIVACPTVRDALDGLALSSRNSYLSTEERRQAQIVPKALDEVQQMATRPDATFDSLTQCIRNRISGCPSARLDYVEIVQYPSMCPISDLDVLVSKFHHTFIVALAIFIGRTRLIDNRIIDPQKSQTEA